MEESQKHECPECHSRFVPIAAGTIRSHKIKGVVCEGYGKAPYTGEQAEGAKGPQCRVCKSPVQLYPTGRVRSHLDRTNEQNPCDGGSDWPLGTYPDIEGSTRGDVATAGDNSWLDADGGSMAGSGDPSDVAGGGSWQEPESGIPLLAETDRGEGARQADRERAMDKAMSADDFLDGKHVMQGRRPVSARPVSAMSADDFLDGTGQPDDDEDEGEETAGPWFPAKYDGSCGTCGTHFDAGDTIRRAADGDWEAQDCCGQDGGQPTAAAAGRPVMVNYQLPVRNGRYVAPHPVTGKPTKYTRCTNFVETLADSIALDQWKGRMAVMGLALRKDLHDKVHSLVQGGVPYELAKTQRDFLNGVVEQAKLAAGSKDRAKKGTILHKHTQEIDSDRRTLNEVPEEFRPDVAVYLRAIEQSGFRLIPRLIERSVLSGELKVVGTFDRVIQAVRDLDAVTLNGRPVQLHEGDCVIGDVKSGASLKFPWAEIEIQEAVYAHAVNENGVAEPDMSSGKPVWRWAPLSEFGVTKVRTDVGVVMHIPYGEAHCELHYTDLIEGWRGAKLCQVVREWRKIKFPESPFLMVAGEKNQEEADVPEKDQWADRFLAVSTREQASTLWAEAKAAGLLKERLLELKELVKLATDVPAMFQAPAPEAPVPEPEPKAFKKGPDWEGRFRAVRDRTQASALWAEAKAAGLPKERMQQLKALVQLPVGKPSAPASEPAAAPAAQPTSPPPAAPPASQEPAPAPDLVMRAHRVTSRAEASVIFQELKRDGARLGEAKCKEIIQIMKDALVPL